MTTGAIILLVCFCIASYFIGNIFFAIIFSKKQEKNITQMGSGNPGTMNMLRNYGFKLGIVTLICDALKAGIPSLIAYFTFTPYGFGTEALYLVGIMCIVGHMFPVTRKFKGGKGMACAFGIILVANPFWSIVCFILAFVYLYFFDYGAVASLLFLTVMCTLEALNPPFLNTFRIFAPATSLFAHILILVLFALVMFAHRTNMVRLIVGKEGKVNLKRSLKKLGMKQTMKEKRINKKEEKKRDIG